MNNTPFKDTKELFLGLMDCFAKKPEKLDFHPLNYQHLKIAQEKYKTIPNILQMENTKYVLKDYHGGGKATSFKRCQNDKIVI